MPPGAFGDGQLGQVLAIRGHRVHRTQRPAGAVNDARCGLWQHGPVSRRAVALAILLVAAAAPACRDAARELAGGPAGSDGPRALVEALADRFGPIDREPAFDALRPKLARAALVPSRVFDDATGVDDPGRRLARGRARRVRRPGAPTASACAREAPPPAAPGQYRGRVRLERVDGGRFEWSVEEELAVGPRPARPTSRRRSTRLFRGGRGARARPRPAAAIARGPPAGLGEARPPPPPRDAGAAAGRPRRDVRAPRGAAHPGRHPRLRPSLRRLPREVRDADPDVGSSSPTRTAPPGGRLEAADNLWTVRLRVRDGSLVPLEGPADRRLPGRLRATVDYATRMGRFEVGAQRHRGRRGAHADAGREGLLGPLPARSPTGSCPSSSEPLLDGPLRYPFEEPGSEVGWAAREAPGGGTRPRRPLPRPGARDLDPPLAGRHDEQRGRTSSAAAPRRRPTASTASACSPCGTTSPPWRRR